MDITLILVVFVSLFVSLSVSAVNSRDDADVEAFNAWVLNNGAKMPKLEIFNQNGYVGVKATSRIAVNELIMQVPSKLILCGSKARESFGDDSIDAVVGEDDGAATWQGSKSEAELVLALLVEKSRGKTSFWYPYVKMLPEEPLSAHVVSVEDIDRVLSGMLAQNGWKIAANGRTAMFASFEKNRESLKNVSYAPSFSFTRADLVWAASMVRSRQYTGCESWCGSSDMCLTPLAELANHDRKGPNWTPLEGNTMGYKARHPVEKGEEISVKYGEMALETSYSTYGFSAGDELPLSSAKFAIKFVMKMAEQAQTGEDSKQMENVKQTLSKSLKCDDILSLTKLYPDRIHFLTKVLMPCARVVFLSLAQVEAGLLTGVQTGDFEGMVEAFRGPMDLKHEFGMVAGLQKMFVEFIESHKEWQAANPNLLASTSPTVKLLVQMRDSEAAYFQHGYDQLDNMLNGPGRQQLEAAFADSEEEEERDEV